MTAFTVDDVQALPGRTLPGGSFVIEPYQQWLMNDVVLGMQTGDRTAHPIFVYVAATGAMGLTWDELFEMCGASASDGPMFGESETIVDTPLRVQRGYEVRGQFCSAERKQGRKAGTFDIVGFELEIVDGDHVVARTRNSIVFPRRTP